MSHDGVRNRSLSARGLEIALTVNPLLRTHAERKAMRVFLQTHFSNLDAPRPELFSADQRRLLAQRYDAEYAELVSAGRGGARGG